MVTEKDGQKITWILKKDGTSILEFDPGWLWEEINWKFLNQWRAENDKRN